jgi:hypothetical protein
METTPLHHRGATLREVVHKLFAHHRPDLQVAPVLSEAHRFPYGPFSFRASVPAEASYSVIASTNLTDWLPIADGVAPSDGDISYLDSDASKLNLRFYRVLTKDLASQNAVGFVTINLPPGFSLITNPFHNRNNTVSDLFKNWPDGTCVNKFDTMLFRLTKNTIAYHHWTQSGETLEPGEGAMFYNPTEDYKSHSFFGELAPGHVSMPIPAGFSLRGSILPQPGHLVDDLHFPIADGDVIQLLDRECQKLILHPYDDGKWKNGPPIIGAGEAFWVAKKSPENWNSDIRFD